MATTTVSIKFPGQYFDSESGLHYNYFRDYDPKTGRYIEPDPIGIDGGVNPFIYVRNNPISFLDLYGLVCCTPEKRRFFNWLNDPLGRMAANLDTTKTLMLTLAAKEGGWNKEGLDHNQPLNNPFGVNEIKNRQASGNKHYPSLDEAISDWESMFGDRVRGTKTPRNFINGLQHPVHGQPYNTADKNYETVFLDVYNAMVRYMEACKIK